MLSLFESYLKANISPKTYRPTNAEKLVLLNLDKLGDNVVEQDVINIPTEQLKGLTKTNLDGAFDKLVKIGIITKNDDGTVQLSDVGQEIVDNIKQKEPDMSPETPETDITNDMDSEDNNSDVGTDDLQMPESLFHRIINDL